MFKYIFILLLIYYGFLSYYKSNPKKRIRNKKKTDQQQAMPSSSNTNQQSKNGNEQPGVDTLPAQVDEIPDEILASIDIPVQADYNFHEEIIVNSQPELVYGDSQVDIQCRQIQGIYYTTSGVKISHGPPKPAKRSHHAAKQTQVKAPAEPPTKRAQLKDPTAPPTKRTKFKAPTVVPNMRTRSRTIFKSKFFGNKDDPLNIDN